MDRFRKGTRYSAAVGIVAWALGFASGGALAQDTPPEPPAAFDTDTLHSDGAGGMLKREPYVRWSQHSAAKPEEAVALIRLSAGDGKPAAEVGGLVIRCDGFVLVPNAVTEALKQGRTATISVTGAEGETVSAPLSLSGWLRTRPGERSRFGLVKTNDHHLRCALPLSAASATPGLSVRVITPAPSGKALCVGKPTEAVIGPPVEGSKDALTLVPTKGGEPVRAPLGSVVADPQTGAILGMVTADVDSQTGAPSFETFTYLHDSVNEVGILPDRQAALDRKVRRVIPGMVLVPGGPVELHGGARRYSEENYKTDVVCMPDFYIDEAPVTNGVYRAWLQTDKTRMQPEAWKRNDEVHNPIRRPELPVKGVAIGDAQSFAAAQSKRLVTEAEWERAAVCTDTRWPAALAAEWDRRMGDATDAFWALNRALVAWAAAATAGRGRRTPQMDLAAAEAARREQELYASIDEFRALGSTTGGIWPTVDAPAGSRERDKSVFKVRDVLMNPDELLESRGPYATRTQKAFASPVDPYLSFIRLNQTKDNVAAVMAGKSPLYHESPLLATVLGIIVCRPLSIKGSMYMSASGGAAAGIDFEAYPIGSLTFRCAR